MAVPAGEVENSLIHQPGIPGFGYFRFPVNTDHVHLPSAERGADFGGESVSLLFQQPAQVADTLPFAQYRLEGEGAPRGL
jgi:hypothetical protein